MNSFKRITALAVLRSFLVTVAFASPVYAGMEVSATRLQVVTDDTARSIHPGMTASEVLAKIGAPYRKMRFDRSGTTAWDYPYQDAFGPAEFSVILDDNNFVVSRIAVRKDS